MSVRKLLTMVEFLWQRTFEKKKKDFLKNPLASRVDCDATS